MKELITFTTGVLVCSGTLLLTYRLLLERRVPFRICRIHLLASMAASLIIPMLEIPVWAGHTVYVTPTATVGAIAAEVMADDVSPAGILPRAVMALYLAGAALMLVLMACQFRRIRCMRVGGIPVGSGKPRIIRTAGNISSFSFFDTIYIGRDTDDSELQSILAHESSHIAHRHSAERLTMELMKAAMWWNPFVWIAQRRLIEVHEYEADADALRHGCDIDHYITTILRSLLGYSPDIANGLRNSLTKKRFEMMTTKQLGSHTLLRTLAVAPVVAGLLCTFSFTAKATDYRTVGQQPEQSVAPDEPQSATIRLAVTDENGAPLGDVKVVAAGREYTTDAGGRLALPASASMNMELIRTGYKSTSYLFSLSGSNADSDIDIKVMMVPDKSDRNNIVSTTMISTSPGQSSMSMQTTVKGDDTPMLRVEKMPTFRGGDLNTFRTYVMSKVRYPDEVLEKGITGRVVASFVVDKQGKITDIEILQTPDRMLSEQVIEVLSQSPAWTAGEQDGEPVKVKFTIPVEFNIAGAPTTDKNTVGEIADNNPNTVQKISVVSFGNGKKDTAGPDGKPAK